MNFRKLSNGSRIIYTNKGAVIVPKNVSDDVAKAIAECTPQYNRRKLVIDALRSASNMV